MRRIEFKVFLLLLLVLHQPVLRGQAQDAPPSSQTDAEKKKAAEEKAQKEFETTYNRRVWITSIVQLGLSLAASIIPNTCSCGDAPDYPPNQALEFARIGGLMAETTTNINRQIAALPQITVLIPLPPGEEGPQNIRQIVENEGVLRIWQDLLARNNNWAAERRADYLRRANLYKKCKWPRRAITGLTFGANAFFSVFDGLNTFARLDKVRSVDIGIFSMDLIMSVYSAWDLAALWGKETCFQAYPNIRRRIGYSMPFFAAVKGFLGYFKPVLSGRRLEAEEPATIASFFSDSLLINLDRALGPMDPDLAVSVGATLEIFFENKFGQDLFIDIRQQNCSVIFNSSQNITGETLEQELKEVLPDLAQLDRDILMFFILQWVYIPVWKTIKFNGTVVEMVAESLSQSSMIFNHDMEEMVQEYYTHIYTLAQKSNQTFEDNDVWDIAKDTASEAYLFRKNMLYDTYLITLNSSSLNETQDFDKINGLFYEIFQWVANASKINPEIMQNLTITEEFLNMREEMKNVFLNTTSPDFYFPPGMLGPNSPPQICSLEPRPDNPSSGDDSPPNLPQDPNDIFDQLFNTIINDLTNEPKITDIANKLKNNPGSSITCPCNEPSNPYQPVDPTEPGNGGDGSDDNTYKIKEPTMEPITTHLPLPEIVLNPQEYIKIIHDPLGPITNPNLFEVFPRLPAPTPPSLGVFGVFADIFRFVSETLVMVATGYVLGGIAEVAAGVTEAAETTTGAAEVVTGVGEVGTGITDTSVDAVKIAKNVIEIGKIQSSKLVDSLQTVTETLEEAKTASVARYEQAIETGADKYTLNELGTKAAKENSDWIASTQKLNNARSVAEQIQSLAKSAAAARLLTQAENDTTSIDQIQSDLAFLFSSSNRSDEENLQAYHSFHSALIEPLQYSINEGTSTLVMLANITSKLNTLPNSLEYQNLILSQTGDHSTASQLFAQVNDYHQNLQYKQTYNYFNYLATQANSTAATRLLVEGEEGALYYYNVSAVSFGNLLQTITFFVSNLDSHQWKDLINQVNTTISTYLSSNNISTWISTDDDADSNDESQIVYIFTEEDYSQRIRFIHDELDSDDSDRKMQIRFVNISNLITDDISSQINQTIRNTFEITAQLSLSTLISSVNVDQGDGTGSGIIAAFQVSQTDQNYYTLEFDGSESYSLWSDSLVYSWDFGDGTNVIRGIGISNVSHTYTVAGNYTITLKVQDIYGHSATSQTPSPITILYNMISWPDSGTSFYIGSKSNVWMVITGNAYVPITPFLNGANKATLFKISNTGAPNVFTLNALGVEGADNANYLGMWGYPRISEASLQASFLPAANTYPTYALWTILPITDDPGYFTIQQNSQYLTISGELQSNFDASICAFTFTSGTGQSQAQLMGKLVDFGSQPISSIQIINEINSNSANKQVKITSPSDSDALFNFIPYNNTGYYTIADELLQQELLTAPGKAQSLFFETSSIPSSDQLWSMHLASSPYLSLSTKEDEDLCLNYDLTHNLISMASCSAQNTGLCYDRMRRFINKPSCKTMLDKICCNVLLLLVPFVGQKLYHDSCHLCSSGKYYCQSVHNQDKLIVESIYFQSEKCTPEKGLSATNSWFLNRIDAATLQDTYMNNVQAKAFSTKNIKLFNIGYQQYLCQHAGVNPYMCDSPPYPINILTFGGDGQIDVPGVPQAGYYIIGSGKSAGYFIVGPYGEDNNRVYSLTLSDNKGHFWQIIRRGYNVFNLRYAWGFNTPRCAAPVQYDPRSSTQILLNFIPCNPLDRNQLWYFGDF